MTREIEATIERLQKLVAAGSASGMVPVGVLDITTALAALGTLAPAATPTPEELAWLIERDIAGVLHYWTGRVIDGREVGAWSVNHLDARRFARREDAACMLTWHCGDDGRVAEHMWTPTLVRKPFAMNVSREWITRMAALEAEHESVAVGTPASGDVPPLVTREQLASIEFYRPHIGAERICPSCHRSEHKPDCWLARALTAPATGAPDARPEIQVGDVVLTERGRRLIVGSIEERPAERSPDEWQRAERNYIDADTGGSVLDVAVIAVYKPAWRRADGGH